MQVENMKSYIREVFKNMPEDWLRLTTHRLDIYDESRAKVQFIEEFDALFQKGEVSADSLASLPTAYDYIRLGHPLSCVLEWAMAKSLGLATENVISFSSRTTPILAVLRKNHLDKKRTQIVYAGVLPEHFDLDVVRKVYEYDFEAVKVSSHKEIPAFEGSTVFISTGHDLLDIQLTSNIDFHVRIQPSLGSVILANGNESADYVSEIQHVRRRESIAMTPANCLVALKALTGERVPTPSEHRSENLKAILSCIKDITGADTKAVVGSSGLSIQYGIVMGLIHHAIEHHPGHPIKLLVPPNCYGGTNDQARRVAACLEEVEVVDLPVDRDHDMATSVDHVLDQVAKEDAVPLIIVEIPTNPRVEVPDLEQLKQALSRPRQNARGDEAIKPVFILDQTFCPNYHFLGEDDILSSVQTISYVSGSKFPSGGLCTAGYCLANKKAEHLMDKIDLHLKLCDNEATNLQVDILAQQMPSMLQRIRDAYINTRDFVDFIQEHLPEAKINFVPQDLAERGFTPSVFSLDLPTKGETHQERETYKRHLNHKLITMMISEIPEESKYCVSYGQLKGCYWTIPATSTQGTTKEEDKDYIARVSCSPDMDMDRHKTVFLDFVREM
jgi:cystathionine beta-lyase/cystathionine gamma-synthase